MSALEKGPYRMQREVDKLRFNAEMKAYNRRKPEMRAPIKPVVKIKRSTHKKDPNAPKRGLTAFLWFCLDERQKVMGMHPDYDFIQVTKELGRLWAVLDLHTLQRYKLMAERDKQRYFRVRALCFSCWKGSWLIWVFSLFSFCRKWKRIRITRGCE